MFQPDRQTAEQRAKWAREERRERFSLFYKMLDFVGVVAGMLCIFVLLALLFSLLSWLSSDVSATFSILRSRFR